MPATTAASGETRECGKRHDGLLTRWPGSARCAMLRGRPGRSETRLTIVDARRRWCGFRRRQTKRPRCGAWPRVRTEGSGHSDAGVRRTSAAGSTRGRRPAGPGWGGRARSFPCRKPSSWSSFRRARGPMLAPAAGRDARLALQLLHRFGSFLKFLSAKNSCSPAVQRNSVPQSTQLRVLSWNSIGPTSHELVACTRAAGPVKKG